MGRVSPSSQNQSGKNKPSKPYVPTPPTQRQNSNPFAPGFEPFYIPPTAPIRTVIGDIPKTEINAQPQNANPFGARFQPFLIPESAPIRKVIGKPQPSRSSALPSLGRGDDIPAAQYPDGVKTGVGGGNAGQAQSTDSKGDAYISPSGRSETRKSPTGVVQTGTNTGYKPMTIAQANRLLSDDYKFDEGYNSNQLPETSTNPYSNVGPVNDGEEYGKMLEMQKPGAVSGVGPVNDGEIYAKNLEAGRQVDLKPSDTDKDPQNSGINWANRSALDNSDKNLARRRAFLDAESSTQGLRDAEATQGLVYASGQHHMLNPNRGQEGQNDFVTIKDKDDVRGYKSGRLSAQDMRDKYVKNIVDNGVTTYDADKVSDSAGPLADSQKYGEHLKKQQDKYKITGNGPVADADEYGTYLKSR